MVYLGMVMAFILHALQQFSQSIAYSLSLWVMEFMVLALIAYEVCEHVIDRRRVGKRKRTILARMNSGQALLEKVPPAVRPERVDKWAREVDEWIHSTRTILESYSSHAVASFNHVRSIPNNYPDVAAGAQDKLKEIAARLENLRSIMEKPEVYY
jgi:hypothetical protein